VPIRGLGCALVAAFAACSTTAPSRPPPSPTAAATAGAPATAVADTSVGPHRAFRLAGFARPESVLYDEFHDRYLVSNSNGIQPGYISAVDPDGTLTAARFIDGDGGGVALRDPHGMAILDGRLYVADVAAVRTFYVDSGRPAGDIEILGATFLNDVTADRMSGRVYVSDTAVLRAADGSYSPNGNDAIYVIEKGVVRPLVRDRALGNPNGLAMDGAGTLLVTNGAGRIYRLGTDGAIGESFAGPGKSLDGLVTAGERLFVSDRDSNAVWERRAGRFAVVGHIDKPADIGWDGKRHRLLVPSIAAGAVEAWDL
jgi:hypothetical protein